MKGLYRFFPYKVLSVPTFKKKGLGTETPAHHPLLLHVVLADNLQDQGGTVVATTITEKQLGSSSLPL